MIDEEEKELADKSAFEYFGKAIELVDVQKLGLYKDGFLAGLKAGRPQWHKVADGDLPKGDEYGKNSIHTVADVKTGLIIPVFIALTGRKERNGEERT